MDIKRPEETIIIQMIKQVPECAFMDTLVRYSKLRYLFAMMEFDTIG